MHIQRWISVLGVVALFLPASLHAQVQQPSAPVRENPPTAAPAQSSRSKTQKPRHTHDFLIKGTVFTPQGLSLPGARIKIRGSGDKEFHWQGLANSRGEFAIRVIQGKEYEVVASAKGCKEQNKSVKATGTDRIEEVVFRMQCEGGKS